MALTPSSKLKLGWKAPDFKLMNCIDNSYYALKDTPPNKATVIMFICNHCPFVKHIFASICEVATAYKDQGVSFIGINSNDATAYPDDSPAEMKKLIEKHHNPFVYLFDEQQTAAKDYKAVCTPEFYIFDENMLCVYHGQFDDSRPGNNISVTGNDLKSALDNLLSNQPINEIQKNSIGCSIKWK